jgi:hypothetical protein
VVCFCDCTVAAFSHVTIYLRVYAEILGASLYNLQNTVTKYVTGLKYFIYNVEWG